MEKEKLESNKVDVITVRDYWGELLKSRDLAYLGLIFRIPPRLWRPLKYVQDELRRVDRNQLYAHPSTFHITVKGLGYLEENLDGLRYEKTVKKLKEIISDFKPFQVTIRGLGVFPTAIYARVEDPLNQLMMMNKRIAEELKDEVEESEYDGDAYIPLVTLATFNNSDVERLFQRIGSEDIRDTEFGICAVYEIEAVQVNMLLALGPEETKEGAFSYVRSFHLG